MLLLLYHIYVIYLFNVIMYFIMSLSCVNYAVLEVQNHRGDTVTECGCKYFGMSNLLMLAS